MKLSRETLDWLLKAALWISAEQSFGDAFEALRTAKNEIRSVEGGLLESTDLTQSDVYQLLESVVWTSRAVEPNDIASNLVETFRVFRPDDAELNGERSKFGETLYDCDPGANQELSTFWNLRVDSAKSRGASSSLHNLFDFVLRTVEIGLHPLQPDPVSFIVGEFSEERNIENPEISFVIEAFHRSARITIDSEQFVSIHDKVIWIDDSSGRMGVVGGEPLPVIGQPEGDEPALRVENEGEEMLQPFHSIQLNDSEVTNNE